MNTKTAKAILEAAEEIGIEMSLREAYSGRCMYGESTAGVVYENAGDLLSCSALAAVRLKESGDCDVEEDFIADLGGLRFDSMGRSLIAY